MLKYKKTDTEDNTMQDKKELSIKPSIQNITRQIKKLNKA